MPQAAMLVVLVLAGLYLAGLGLTALLRPQRVAVFLSGFAATAPRHYLELGLRLLVGTSFIVLAPGRPFAAPMAGFGWLLVVTSLVLAVVPWRVHRRFAAAVVPPALRHLRLVGVSSLLAGLAVLAWVIA